MAFSPSSGLAFNDKGREILKLARQNGMFINAGEKTDTEYEALETKCGALYTLFANDPGSPSLEQKRRIKHL